MTIGASSALQASIYQLTLKFVTNGILSGSGITKDNLATISQTSAESASQQFAQDLASAIDTWLQNTILLDQPSQVTVGSAVTQTVITPGTVTKS